MPMITVFTSTYNRGHLLHTCYESLKRQKDKDFEWLIVDDGSTDNTKEIVEEWKKELNGFEIRYISKPNGGLSSGYNTAIANLKSELAVCIDSDDALADDAITLIKEAFAKYGADKEIAGIIGLDVDPQGKVIGHEFHREGKINAVDLMPDRTIGDKKYVFKTDLLKSVCPIPIIEGEKDLNPHYLVLKLSEQFKFAALNIPLCVVDYQENGMSSNMWKQFLNSPRSFLLWRQEILKFKHLPLSYRFRMAVHLYSSAYLLKERVQINDEKVLYFFAKPFGYAWSKMVQKKGKD